MTERELCIGLNMISGIGSVRYRALCEAFGSPDAVRGASRGELQEIPGIGRITAERMVAFDWDAELSRELSIAERGGVRILTLADEDYPKALREIFDPPICLYIRGRLPEDPERSVAIVGSRRISGYGERMAKMLAEEATQCGFTVFSGLAAGTDTVVHRAVTELAGKTVGVIGGGLLHMYPRENIPLAREMIASGGAVMSEFPLDFPINRRNFPRRNRIVAGMCRAVIVVEAGVDSGALITARLAAEMGKEVFAVPGRVDNMQARGCHRLIKEGAGLAENFDDVLMALSTGLRPGELNAATGEVTGTGELPPECELILGLLANGDADLEELQEATGMEPGALLSLLTGLEMKLLVSRDSDMYYHLAGSTLNRRGGGRDF